MYRLTAITKRAPRAATYTLGRMYCTVYTVGLRRAAEKNSLRFVAAGGEVNKLNSAATLHAVCCFAICEITAPQCRLAV